MKLFNIYDRLDNETLTALYDLLAEREPHQNISHKRLPDFNDHACFVQSFPYRYWALILVKNEKVGGIYLSYNNEIGVQIFKEHQGKGYGKQAVKMVMERFEGPFLANINPKNEGSISMFESMGFEHIQNTYRSE